MNAVDAQSADDSGGAAIRGRLSAGAAELLSGITVLEETDSTNSFVGRMPPDRRHGHAVLARRQMQGRGRRQRHWHSPPGGNVYLSLGWNFANGSAELSTLPLLVAVCLARALERVGLRGHGVKWPNDILVDGRKLAGILVESQSSGNGGFQAIIGIGVNMNIPDSTGAASIGRPWTDLVSELGLPAAAGLDASAAAGEVLDELLPALRAFGETGFAPFRADWARFDLLAGKEVRVDANGRLLVGRALGIDAAGSLMLQTTGGTQAVHHGEASILRE